MRMVERRDGFRLPFETRSPLLARSQIGRKHFEGHIPVELRILGKVDVSHPARAELLENLVVGEGAPNHRGLLLVEEAISSCDAMSR